MGKFGNGIQDSCECGHARTSHRPETGECYRFPCLCNRYRDLDNPTCHHCKHSRQMHTVGHSLPIDPDVCDLGESSWHGNCRSARCRCNHFEIEPQLDVVMRGKKILRLVRAAV